MRRDTAERASANAPYLSSSTLLGKQHKVTSVPPSLQAPATSASAWWKTLRPIHRSWACGSCDHFLHSSSLFALWEKKPKQTTVNPMCSWKFGWKGCRTCMLPPGGEVQHNSRYRKQTVENPSVHTSTLRFFRIFLVFALVGCDC